MKVKSESEVAQSYLTLSDPMDYSLPGSSIHGFSRQEYWSGVPLPSPDLKISRGNKTEKNEGKPGRKISLCKGPGWEGAGESLNWEKFCVAKCGD